LFRLHLISLWTIAPPKKYSLSWEIKATPDCFDRALEDVEEHVASFHPALATF
jgi:hypothetical protein